MHWYFFLGNKNTEQRIKKIKHNCFQSKNISKSKIIFVWNFPSLLHNNFPIVLYFLPLTFFIFILRLTRLIQPDTWLGNHWWLVIISIEFLDEQKRICSLISMPAARTRVGRYYLRFLIFINKKYIDTSTYICRNNLHSRCARCLSTSTYSNQLMGYLFSLEMHIMKIVAIARNENIIYISDNKYSWFKSVDDKR